MFNFITKWFTPSQEEVMEMVNTYAMRKSSRKENEKRLADIENKIRNLIPNGVEIERLYIHDGYMVKLTHKVQYKDGEPTEEYRTYIEDCGDIIGTATIDTSDELSLLMKEYIDICKDDKKNHILLKEEETLAKYAHKTFAKPLNKKSINISTNWGVIYAERWSGFNGDCYSMHLNTTTAYNITDKE